MISTCIAYGYLVTNDFGGPINNDVRELVKTLRGHVYEADWLVHCSTVEGPQLLIGIHADINKKTDFAALHQQWEKVVATIPKDIRKMMDQANLGEPDVAFMAGHS